MLQMKAMQGVKMSYRLHELLQRNNTAGPLRGARVDDVPTSLNSYLYSLIRGNRSQRRGLLTSLLNMFDDTAVSLLLLLVAQYLSTFFSHHIFLQFCRISKCLKLLHMVNECSALRCSDIPHSVFVVMVVVFWRSVCR